MEKTCDNCKHRYTDYVCMCLDCDPETLNMWASDADNAQYVREHLSKAALLGQLCEELSEAAAAVAKLQRIVMGENPTPVSYDAAYKNLVEELADIDNCMSALELHADGEYYEIMEAKMQRWADRIREAEHERESD